VLDCDCCRFRRNSAGKLLDAAGTRRRPFSPFPYRRSADPCYLAESDISLRFATSGRSFCSARRRRRFTAGNVNPNFCAASFNRSQRRRQRRLEAKLSRVRQDSQGCLMNYVFRNLIAAQDYRRLVSETERAALQNRQMLLIYHEVLNLQERHSSLDAKRDLMQLW
jgi:hypothetical protein